jgi:alpha-ketoglutarate-dependent taurine dioxygenase
MRFENIKPHVGARVYVDRAKLCDPAVVQQCLTLLEDRGVLVIPRIGVSDQEQMAFTNALGTQTEGTRKFPGANAVGDGIFELSFETTSKMQYDYVKTSFFWHIDGLLSDDPVPKAALLSARRVPPKGGQTEFSNTFAAYDCLPEDEKAEIAGLTAMHSAVAGMRWVIDLTQQNYGGTTKQEFPTKEHGVVWAHKSGRKSMRLGTTADYVIGMPVPDGRHLLTRLLEWSVQPDFTYRHQWEEGDLVIWNNHGVLHRVLPYDEKSGRSMRRTSFEQARA